MAKLFKLLLAAVVASLAVACSTQELDGVNERLNNLESCVSELERLCKEMNTNISSLQGIVTAMQSGDYITSVTPITSGDKTIGYTISFAKGQPITIYHGEDGADGKDGANGHTPVIGVKQDTDGIWHWTLDGQWLLDDNGQKIKAVGVDGKDGEDGKDGITPQLKIEDGYWYVSTNNGESWAQLGKATGENGKDSVDGQDGKDGVDGKDGDSMFQSVTVTDTEVTFVTSDGQTFTIKRAPALSIEFDSADLVVMGTNATRDIHYTITSGVDDITIEALSSTDIKVKVVKTNAKAGMLNVKTGPTIDEYSKVVVLVSNGSQAIMRVLNFEEEAIEVEENTTKEVSDEGGEVTLEFFSNTLCHAIIPEDAQSWISNIPESKTLYKQSIQLYIQPNSGPERSAVVTVSINSQNDNDAFLCIPFTIQQEAGVWSSGTIPPDDEIWYVTEDNNKLDLYSSVYGMYDMFNVGVVEHTYKGGKGVIKCEGAITEIKSSALTPKNSSFDKITELYLPNSIRTIEAGGIEGLNIKTLRIPDNLQPIGAGYNFWDEDGEYMTGELGIRCNSLERLEGNNVSDDQRALIINGVMYVVAPFGLSSYTIPDNVKCIHTGLFAGCQELQSVKLNEGLKKIGSGCFYNSKLTGNIILPQSLKYINYLAFSDCPGITGFYGNDALTSKDHLCLYSIDNMYHIKNLLLFVGKNVESYEIENDVNMIENYAFDQAHSLKNISVPGTISSVGSWAFANCEKIERVLGQGASQDQMGIMTNGVFHSLLVRSGTKQYTIPQGTKIIAYGALERCKDLEEIYMDDDVEAIGGLAFANNPRLKKVVLSAKLRQIGYYYFNTIIPDYNPFIHSNNLKELFFRSPNPPEYTDTQFNNYSDLKVYVPEESIDAYKQSGWSQYAPYMVGYEYDDLDYYLSSDFSSDGTTSTPQQSSSGNGVDLVLLGDAFSDRQIADGTYAEVMRKAADAFFSEEPYKSMKDKFNVYTVNVVSAIEGYEYSGQALSTGHGDGSYVYGNDAKVIEYAKKAIGEERLDDAVIIVMMNEDAYAGTCFMYNPPSGNYGRGLSIAYFPTSSDETTFNGLVSHEAGGHGFAKLADEYAYEYMGAITNDAINSTKVNEPYGWWKNVDFTSDPATVKWSQFLSDPRYANEGLGCFEGGLTYWTGVWRPTDASIMRYNTGGFNAPSRYAIWYRIGKLAYGESWEGSYEDFVAYDAVNRTPAAVQRRSAQRRNYVEKPLPQLPPPVVVGHSWREELNKK